MMPVKSGRDLILCIDQQGIGGNLGAGGTMKRVGQQRPPQPLPAECLVCGQTSHPDGSLPYTSMASPDLPVFRR